LSFSFPNFLFDFFQYFYVCIEFLFHTLHCLLYFIQLFICILLELIQTFICDLFTFIDHPYNHSFEIFEISSTSLSLVSIIMLLSCFFHISYVSALGFVHLRKNHWKIKSLYSFSWRGLCIQTGWCSCWVEVYSPLDWG
jgi:hypothetical protein